MGRFLGSHTTDELDRPDLNRCPECGSYFAPTSEYCPICSAFCPDEYRAGNRKPVKAKRQTFSRSSSRVTFVEWYHSWWFIALALLFMPLVGVVLLITSPHKKSHKLIFAAIAVLYTVLVSWGVGGRLIGMLRGMESPVDSSLSMTEYVAVCETVDAEAFYRTADSRIGDKIEVTLTVRAIIADVEGTYNHELYPNYYLCSDAQQRFTVLVRDCVKENRINLLPGDVVTFWGECVGSATVTDQNHSLHTAPCLNAAYAELKGEEPS